MSPVPVATHDVSATRPARPAGAVASPAATRQQTGDVRSERGSSGTAIAAVTSGTSAPAAAQGPRRGPATRATDDEILEILSPAMAKSATPEATGEQRAFFDPVAADRPSADETQRAGLAGANEPENLRTVFDANPELRQAWQDANAYRETFATPEDARAATAQLADLDRMDALFFSRRPEDHAELARSIVTLDPAAFASLAQAMEQLTWPAQARSGEKPQLTQGARADVRGDAGTARNDRREQSEPQNENQVRSDTVASTQREPGGPTAAQSEFFQAANAEAVQGVLGAIESQVERLLPDGVSKSARNRVVGEIYRELDSALRSNRQFGQQMREAFRSGALDADHQHAIVSLITGRVRQTLPGVAKRVRSEWTSTVVAANQDRRARQRAAEGRVDIAGSAGAGSEGRRSMAPRDIDYARMSDSEILNL